MSSSGLDPALALLSALASPAAVLYCVRAFGAAAVRPVRAPNGRIVRLLQDPRWTHTLVAYLGGSALVAAVVSSLNIAIGRVASEEAAFGALLVAVLWRHAGEAAVRGLLALLLLGVGAARVALGAELLAAVAAGYVIGLCSAWALHLAMQRRATEDADV